GGGVGGEDIAAGAGVEVECAVDHEGRGFEVTLLAGTEVIGLPAPGDLESFDVIGVDLVEQGVFGGVEVGGVVAPFGTGDGSGGRRGLAGGEGPESGAEEEGGGGELEARRVSHELATYDIEAGRRI